MQLQQPSLLSQPAAHFLNTFPGGPCLQQLRYPIVAAFLCGAILLALAPASALGQLPVYSCQPNAAGDGWVCVSSQAETGNTANRTNQYNSGNAVLPSVPQAGAGSIQPQPPEIEANVPAAEPELDAPAQEPVTPDPQSDQSAIRPAPEPTPPSGSATGTTSSEPAPGQTAATAFITEIVAPNSDYLLDWMPREAMTPAQQESLAANCCGGFFDPSLELFAGLADPSESETVFKATTGLSQISQNLITIDGDVIVQQGARTIENNETTSINRGQNTVLMDGDVVFREPGLMLRGSSAFIDSDDQVNRIESAQYVLHDFGAHGDAQSVVYSSETGQVTIDNGAFSRCEPENEFWTLSAESILLDQEAGRGYAKAASIRIRDVPVFYYPFTLPFPLGDGRVSGLLPPSIGTTRTGGVDIELPYYLNLAPHYDATIAPRLLGDRGVMLGAEFRYLASWSMNTLNLSGLSRDDQFDPATKDIRTSDSPPRENRWFVGFEHQGALGQHFSTYIDYNAVSDDDYFYDFGGAGLNVTSQNHLNRQGVINFNSSLLQAGLNVQRVQIIDPFLDAENIYKPYDRLPQFFFNTGAALPLGLRFGLRGEVAAFDRDLDETLLNPALIDNGVLVSGERINLAPRLSWSLETPGWFVRANATYQHSSYELENQAVATLSDPEVNIPIFSFDSGLVFERSMSNGSTQTLEPRVFYLKSEFEDQSMLPLFDTSELNFSFSQLFREDRFAGGDRTSNAEQVAVALTSRFLDVRGKERLRVGLGQIQYFEDRLVSLSNPLQNWIPRYSPLADQSAYIGEVALSVGEFWRFNTDFQWNEDRQELDEGSLALRYQRDSNHLFNLAFRYRSLTDSPFFILPPGIDPRIKQSDVSGIWPLSPNWKLLGRINYDHSNSRNLESFAGVEWSNCCATIRLVGREWVDENQLFLPNSEPNRGFFVQFTLNGLGNLAGGGLSNLLQDGIWGFRDADYEQN